MVFLEALERVADGANATPADVSLAVNEIEEAVFDGVVQQAVDGEVAPPHVLLRRLGVADLARVAAVRVTPVAAEGCHFDCATILGHSDHTEVSTHCQAAGVESQDLFRSGISGYVIVGRL